MNMAHEIPSSKDFAGLSHKVIEYSERLPLNDTGKVKTLEVCVVSLNG
jgi:hypothetical protein